MKRLLIITAALVVVIAVAIGAVVAIQLLRSDDPDLLTSAPQIPTPSATSAVATVVSTTGVTPTPSATTTTTPTASPTAAAQTSAGTLHFVIDAGSSAKYVVREKLAALPVSSDAVGTTSDITGDFYLTPTGLATGQASSFKVDLRTLKTDEALRDRFVRDQTLQTGRFPTADFVVTNVTPFPTNYVEGTEVSINITGNMTIHGVTKPLTFTSKARKQGSALTGIADVDFKMSDFNITPPNVQLAKSEDGVHLQIVIVAKLA
jgi:polyisoprenoid-binding protein YceI